MRPRQLLALAVSLVLFAAPQAEAACTDPCCAALPPGGVVPGIFQDALGRSGPALPVLGRFLAGPVAFSCRGTDPNPHTIGKYLCDLGDGGGPPSDIHPFADHLDHQFIAVYRACSDGGLVPDSVPGCLYPPRGLLYDLGGRANKVAFFPVIMHGPLPLHAFAVTVYLSDDPAATDVVPRGGTPDPSKWNETTLTKIFEDGWSSDPLDIDDDWVSIWSLPSGYEYRFASIVPGIEGNPSGACTLDMTQAGVNAVAGLGEDGAGLSPSEDLDAGVSDSSAPIPDASPEEAGTSGAEPGESAGCGCRITGGSSSVSPAWLLALVLAPILRRKRRVISERAKRERRTGITP